MKDTDKQDFAKIIWLFATEAGVSIDKAQLSIKFERLKKYEINQISEAANYLLENRKKTFPAIPTIVEFIETINIQSDPLKMLSDENIAEMQSIKVLDTLRKKGADSNPKFKDSITASLMTTRWPFYSWGRNLLEKDEKWWIKDFIRLYTSYKTTQKISKLIDLKNTTKNIPDFCCKEIESF